MVLMYKPITYFETTRHTHQNARGPCVPFVSCTPGGSRAPETHDIPGSKAFLCRRRYAVGSGSAMFTSGACGSSLNFNQQSPNEWVCASGSKHLGCPHQVQMLHGNRPKGPRRG